MGTGLWEEQATGFSVYSPHPRPDEWSTRGAPTATVQQGRGHWRTLSALGPHPWPYVADTLNASLPPQVWTWLWLLVLGVGGCGGRDARRGWLGLPIVSYGKPKDFRRNESRGRGGTGSNPTVDAYQTPTIRIVFIPLFTPSHRHLFPLLCRPGPFPPLPSPSAHGPSPKSLTK